MSKLRLSFLILITGFGLLCASSKITIVDGTGLKNQISSSTQKTLLIDAPIYLTQNTIIGENVHLEFTRKGLIHNAGYTLQINGSVDAGLWQIFDSRILFGGNSVAEVYPQWWGAIADDQSATAITKNTTAFKYALYNNQTSYYQGKRTVKVPKGNYYLNTISCGNNKHIVGTGREQTTLNFVSGNGLMIDKYCTVRDITIVNKGSDISTTKGIVSLNQTTANGAAYCLISNVEIRDFAYGFAPYYTHEEGMVWMTKFDNVIFKDNHLYDFYTALGGNTTITFNGCHFYSYRAQAASVFIDEGHDISFYGCAWQSPNADYNLYMRNSTNVLNSASYYEPLCKNKSYNSQNVLFESGYVDGIANYNDPVFSFQGDKLVHDANKLSVELKNFSFIHITGNLNLYNALSIVPYELKSSSITFPTSYTLNNKNLPVKKTNQAPKFNGVNTSGNLIPEMLSASAVVEYGVSKNIRYWRYENGMQICMTDIQVAPVAKNTTNYYTTITLPKPFKTGSWNTTGVQYSVSGSVYANVTESAKNYLQHYNPRIAFRPLHGDKFDVSIRTDAGFSDGYIYKWVAIGMWK